MTEDQQPQFSTPTFAPSYPSGADPMDNETVLTGPRGRTYTVRDLKDAIWWLFYGTQHMGRRTETAIDGHGFYVSGIVEALGQNINDFHAERNTLRSAESVALCLTAVHEDIDQNARRRAEDEAKERADYERLHAKFGGAA